MLIIDREGRRHYNPLKNMKPASRKKVPLTRIQKLIGKLMLQSKQEGAFFYLQSEADVTELVAIRKPYCKRVKARITTNDFFFRAIARAIKKFPLMAGRLDETGKYIDITEHIGIGFAVSAAQGLVVPVVQDVADKSLIQIASESDELLKKARANKLMPDDFYGANIAVTSLGMYGVTSFFAIAPPGTVGSSFVTRTTTKGASSTTTGHSSYPTLIQ